MNHRFLRDEAARFRGMADDTDREATKLRLLSMAADYEARAEVAIENADAHSDDVAAVEATVAPAEPNRRETLTVRPVRKLATRPKETIVVERRPAVRRGAP